MFKKLYIKTLFIIFLLSITTVVLSGVPVWNYKLLVADFDDKVPGSVIGTGGAAVGEPTEIIALDTEIIEISPGHNVLSVSNDLSSTSARPIRWQFLDNAEITEGLVIINYELTPSALDRYNLQVRESGSSASSFLTVTFDTSGGVSATDSNGAISLNSFSYAAGETQFITAVFDMDAKTSGLYINGTTLFTDRSHGITNRGVGRMNTGFNSSSNGNPFIIDNIRVVTPFELPLILDVDLEDKTLGQPIGTGGAIHGEPVSVSPDVITEVIEFDMDNQALQIENDASGINSSVNWNFLYDSEIPAEGVAIELDVLFNSLDSYLIGVRESSGVLANYLTLRFFPDGSIGASDENGVIGFVGNYEANQLHRIRMIFDFVDGTYTALIDEELLIQDRSFNLINGGGIGSVFTGFRSDASDGAFFIIDDLQVGSSIFVTDVIFENGFED